MQEISDRLGRGRGDGEKTRLAKKLGQEADSLLTCPEHNHDSQDCKNCRAIAQRRKNTMWGMLKNMKTAPIIITADKRRP